jgi:hypothetical protein
MMASITSGPKAQAFAKAAGPAPSARMHARPAGFVGFRKSLSLESEALACRTRKVRSTYYHHGHLMLVCNSRLGAPDYEIGRGMQVSLAAARPARGARAAVTVLSAYVPPKKILMLGACRLIKGPAKTEWRIKLAGPPKIASFAAGLHQQGAPPRRSTYCPPLQRCQRPLRWHPTLRPSLQVAPASSACTWRACWWSRATR